MKLSYHATIICEQVTEGEFCHCTEEFTQPLAESSKDAFIVRAKIHFHSHGWRFPLNANEQRAVLCPEHAKEQTT